MTVTARSYGKKCENQMVTINRPGARATEEPSLTLRAGIARPVLVTVRYFSFARSNQITSPIPGV